MDIIAIGVDVSKGYVDVCFRNAAGSDLAQSGRFDDTQADHERLLDMIAALAARHPSVELRIGVECSGGLERNWLASLRRLKMGRVYRLNPLAVKKFLERDLHRNTTDELSARGIAAYLLNGLRAADIPYEEDLEGARNLARYVGNSTHRKVQMGNELHSLLVSVHPELVQYCRSGMPEWVLHVLVRYPTAKQLGKASAAALARIRYLKPQRAEGIIATAKTSVAALGDAVTAEVVRRLAKSILTLGGEIEALKAQIGELVKDDEQVKICESIPGIGRWTAALLRLECGRFERFHSACALVAYTGLDPRVYKSGDGEIHKGISRRGKPLIRGALQMPTRSAIEHNPAITAFHARLIKDGKKPKVASTACMAKLLRIAYSCVVSGQSFDPHRDAEVRARYEEEHAPKPINPEAEESLKLALAAPITRREVQRRRQEAVKPPQLWKGRDRRIFVCG